MKNKFNILDVAFYIYNSKVTQCRIDQLSWCSVNNKILYKLNTMDFVYEDELHKSELDAITSLIDRKKSEISELLKLSAKLTLS